MKDLIIEAQYDEEARVWVAINDELGLVTEAETLNNLDVSWPVSFTLHTVRRTTAFA